MTNGKIVAVLSSNIRETFRWLMNEFEIEVVEEHIRWCKSKNGTQYVIVTEPSHIYGMTFTDLIESPQYETLVDIARARIKIIEDKERNAKPFRQS